MELTINVLELASDLADQKVYDAFKYSTNEAMYVLHPNGDTHYTEKAQDIFNEWYVYYQEIINQYEV